MGAARIMRRGAMVLAQALAVLLPAAMSEVHVPAVDLDEPQMDSAVRTSGLMTSDVNHVKGEVIPGKGTVKDNCLCYDCPQYKWVPSVITESTTELKIWRNAKLWFKWYVQLSPGKKTAVECMNMCLCESECSMSTFFWKTNSCWHYNKIAPTHRAKRQLDQSLKGGANNDLTCFIKDHDLFNHQQADAVNSEVHVIDYLSKAPTITPATKSIHEKVKGECNAAQPAPAPAPAPAKK